ncbi:ABC transporter ATP-binding protein [Pseudobacteriovorax antillogorgiicola]|uniref:ABC-2 type transport system ATP-binding protein n=1 Tax=Pseudobacteriovorax antillogorgiicola TaxID=1513793 RepID=A0A1Y6CJY5_9BACT|nr:ABC transporter ATP-binding protein [Pseudobacteriovorax antillogorgiicola]TCS46353.1 ABC-2 type transport system ATP-binding protein [Pseudobacteriovorax antillogorgiicola]SMF68180.1 ABC-2 type transport system ATP-binding protein [Pseudobacteriovorax antillogorgiicola]
MIRAQQLCKTYRLCAAVKDLSFEVRTGEVVGLIGPNGAGKSTTMKMITGSIYPDSGTITILDHDFTPQSRDLKREIGYLPENCPLYQDLTVFESLNFLADLRGLSPSKRRERYDQLALQLSLEDVWYQPVLSLSKGFRQRLGLALALLPDPQLLILDEPTDGLDPRQTQEVVNLIKQLSHSKTILISTHDLGRLANFCQRVIMIHRGRKVADQSIAELTRDLGLKSRFKLSFENHRCAEKAMDTLRNQNFLSLVSHETEVTGLISGAPPELIRLLGQLSPQPLAMEIHPPHLDEVFNLLTQEGSKP